MYTQNQFNHVLNTLFEPFDEALHEILKISEEFNQCA
jgi:hypothetical protein